jgi:hypothetical protein
MPLKDKTAFKVVIGCLVSLAIFALLCAAGTWYAFFRVHPTLESHIDFPAQVVAGNPFDLRVYAVNPHPEAVVLDSIDISDSFLDGVQIVSIDPRSIDTLHFYDMRSWEFGLTVDAGTTLTVTFRCKALRPGHYTGGIDVCNPNQNYTSSYADLIVSQTE